MMPTTGYTPEIDERRKLRNEIKACITNYRYNLQNGWVVNEGAANYYYNRAVSAIAAYRAYKLAHAADPRTAIEQAQDADDADTEATRRSDAPIY